MSEQRDPGLFIFKEDERLIQETTSNYPSKPHDNLPSNNPTHEEHKPVSLYEYSLGIRNIEAKHVTYSEAEVFVTKPMHVYGNVMEVEVEAGEEHPVFDEVNGNASPKQTSVEYFVSYKQKPNTNDWHPLLPLNQRTVRGERLFIENGKGKMLFPARMDSIEVFENGLKMKRNEFLLLNNQEIQIIRPTSGGIYTVNYTPDSYKKNPWTLQLNDYKQHVQRITEIFPEGTDINKTVSLKYTPFIDMERIVQEENYNPNTSDYRPIEVRLIDASIQGKNRTVKKLVEPYRPELSDDAFTYNKTLYLDKSWSDMKGYSLDPESSYGGFDYYQHKNKLTFTEHFNVKTLRENMPHTHGNAGIEVTYDALVTDFRLKIILRRNTATENTATPKVTDYQIRLKTAD